METTNTRTLEALRARRAERERERAERAARRDGGQRDSQVWDKMIARRWQDAAACEGAADLFTTTDATEAGPAADICATCDVVEQCRNWVERERQYEGVAAGLVFKHTKIPVLVDGKVKQRDVRTATPIRTETEGSAAA
ncbi:WhiB family transcriptional regulator [Promicromonospora sukumoe]|uniref:WhiB family transcriptional regulator n=1 Tax=Promicromonospora sukumoe TaxID=88382 RepID=UPI0037C61AA5